MKEIRKYPTLVSLVNKVNTLREEIEMVEDEVKGIRGRTNTTEGLLQDKKLAKLLEEFIETKRNELVKFELQYNAIFKLADRTNLQMPKINIDFPKFDTRLDIAKPMTEAMNAVKTGLDKVIDKVVENANEMKPIEPSIFGSPHDYSEFSSLDGYNPNVVPSKGTEHIFTHPAYKNGEWDYEEENIEDVMNGTTSKDDVSMSVEERELDAALNDEDEMPVEKKAKPKFPPKHLKKTKSKQILAEAEDNEKSKTDYLHPDYKNDLFLDALRRMDGAARVLAALAENKDLNDLGQAVKTSIKVYTPEQIQPEIERKAIDHYRFLADANGSRYNK